MDLPGYSGERATYLSWKENMKAYLEVAGIPDNLRGHYIFDSLRGSSGSNQPFLRYCRCRPLKVCRNEKKGWSICKMGPQPPLFKRVFSIRN